MNIAGMKCLVTGGAGFIGSHLVDLLMGRGCRVRVLDNLANGSLDNISRHLPSGLFEFVQGSVTDAGDVGRAVHGVDVVFHLACLGVRHSLIDPMENHRTNAEGTLNVLEASRLAGVKRFLYCSSSEIYGTAQYVPMPESHPARPCTVYGAGKLAGEAYARAYFKTYGMEAVMVRPFNVYGPRSHHEGDAGEAIPKFIVRALNGRELVVFGDGSQTRDFTFVEDTARGLLAAMECDHAVGRTLNMGSGWEVSIGKLAGLIIEAVGNKGAAVKFTDPRPGDVLRLFADSSRFMQMCGWRPEVGFEEGLRRTVEYFRGHPLGAEALLRGERGRNWER